MPTPNKSLGQHWLRDRSVLGQIADYAELTPDDTVLEIGPGQGSLTSVLLGRAARVVAVEFDGDLAAKLPAQFPGKNLEVISGDILTFDLGALTPGYKVVANVPYYITSKIVQLLMTAKNQPSRAILLVQKEVAERLAAKPGDMSILAISAQVFADIELGAVVPASLFTPPPKVDSQVVILRRRPTPLVPVDRQKQFFQVVKAGFSAKRKKLRSSLAGGLNLTKAEAAAKLIALEINPDSRAEELSIADWKKIAETI